MTKEKNVMEHTTDMFEVPELEKILKKKKKRTFGWKVRYVRNF